MPLKHYECPNRANFDILKMSGMKDVFVPPKGGIVNHNQDKYATPPNNYIYRYFAETNQCEFNQYSLDHFQEL